MSELTIDQALKLGVQLHQSGRLNEAESIYRQILAAQPNDPDALHLMGLVALQVGKLDVAFDLIARAIGVAPNVPDYHYNLGQAFAAAGRGGEAAAAYRKALELRPNHPQAWNNLGNALHAMGQPDQAVAALQKAIELRPDYAQANYNLGTVLHATGRVDQAIAAFQQALAIQPDLPEAWNNLGNALRQKGRADDAIAAYRKTCDLEPGHAEAHSNLGCLLQEAGRLDEALSMLQKAISLRPDSAAAHYNLGNTLRAMDRLDNALAEFRQACALKPDFADAYNAIGYTLREKGEIPEAVGAYRQALALEPQNARAHHNLAHVLLLQGQLEEAWPHHEWRFQAVDPDAPANRLSQPMWDGSDLSGRTLFLHAEQGFGDAIQFARYVPLAAQRRGGGGSIIVECRRELARLLGGVSGVDQVISRESDDHPLPPFDAHCPLLSLPMVFRTSLATIPANVPYIHPDAGLSSQWRRRIQTSGIKVGLVWAGRPNYAPNRFRSVPFSAFAPMGEVGGASFFSLQKERSGFSDQGSGTASSSLPLTDWTDELQDFADTAALIDNLDLVITVDTAVAHLAGAMGKAVWVLIPIVPDWRWMLERSDSPWYPSMRLYRQTTLGDWEAPIRQIAQALQHRIEGKGASTDAS